MSGQLEQYQQSLPNKPYATDNLGYGLRICYKQKAITKRYLQHNPPAKIHWLVFDCDKAGALEVANQIGHCPAPSFEVVNPDNGHSHLFYGLAVPVVRTDLGRAKPLAYLASVEYALREVLGADEHYTGMISKNPLHPHWMVIEYEPELWSIGELAEYLTLPAKLPKKATQLGIGRNCTLFETVRKWAYRQILAHRISGTQETFSNAVLKACEKFNDFPEPLPFSEIRAISKSISRWVWKKYEGRWSDEEFSARQASRARKGKGVARYQHTEEERAEAVLKARQAGAKQADVAKAYGVTSRTLRNWLRGAA
ncbi:MAG: plasmid replication protein [Cytophagaceae bacterium]|nr:MAG: plasmid replication protein [Cytophagaceae bacterium]